MNLKNHTYYFGKVPERYKEDMSSLTPKWNADYYYRFRIDAREEEVKFEDSCGRMVPLSFEHLYEFHKTFDRLLYEMQANLIGEPLLNSPL